MAAILECHAELAKRKSSWDIKGSKNAVEAVRKEFTHASSRYCVYAGQDPLGKQEQPEEARRAWYEWKALHEMMEQVVE